MTLRSRFRGWRRKRKRQKVARKPAGPLREFVYLDDVSVYSLLASRLGAIATEFTETETVSLNSEVASSLGGSFGLTKAELKSRFETGHSQGSQVLRKSIVQTAFKDLYELESESLALSPGPTGTAPATPSMSTLEGNIGSTAYEGWIIDPEHLERGNLIEAEVELETESIFRVSAVITTILEIMQENLQLFGADNVSQVAEMRSVGRVLESLLAGLVPIRGRLVDYGAFDVGGREMLVHQKLLDQLDPGHLPPIRPVFVVGVAERSLFWKDIRRVLFAGAKYRVFCRISKSGLSSQWRPVKLVDVLNEVHPVLGQQVDSIGDMALLAMGNAVAGSTSSATRREAQQSGVIERYANLLAEHHGKVLSSTAVDSLVSEYSSEPDWLNTVDQRRIVLAEVTRRIDEITGVETSKETAATYRVAALADLGLGLGGTLMPKSSSSSGISAGPRDERFLDTEIVAIYW